MFVEIPKECQRPFLDGYRSRPEPRLLGLWWAAAILLATLAIGGCGDRGETTAAAPSVVTDATSGAAAAKNYFTMTQDGYGLLKPNFLYTSDNPSFWTIEANVAKNATDVDSACIYRIEISKQDGTLPCLNKTFSIESGTSCERFPGEFLVFNGQKSTAKKVESGLISFSPDSTSVRVKGTFDVIMTDYDAGTLPAPRYRLKGLFDLKMGTSGLMIPDVP